MKKVFSFFLLCFATKSFALNSTHFTINRISAPYFIVDGNSPATINKAYVGFEVKNNSNSAVTYSGLKFTITSIGTSVVGQNYSIVAPVDGIANIGTLAPGESKTCYFYVTYPAAVAPQATFNIQLTDNTAGVKTQSFVISNRSSISANAGGTATQTFTNQDLIGGLIYDDVTYVVGNVQNGDESDLQVAVSTMFDPTKITLLGTEVLSSSVPGIPAGATDSLYFITGNGSNGATVTVRWIFRITGVNFTTYLLPCAGATSGSTNYKYALNTALGSGTPITVSSSANPLIITKTSDQLLYGAGKPALFTITISNPGAFGVTIDKITDQVPAGFTFQSIDVTSQVTAANSTSVPASGATGNIVFEGGVVSGGNSSYYIPAGGSIMARYTATSPASSAIGLVTTARGYVAAAEIGAATNTVSVNAILPYTLFSFNAGWTSNEWIKLDWKIINELANDIFLVQKSTDNINFTTIGQVKSTGVTGVPQYYTFIDSFPAKESNRYRLKVVNGTGLVKYSPIIFVTRQQNGWDIAKVFPSPFNNELNIQVMSDKKITVQVELTNLMGHLIVTRSANCINGTNMIVFDQLAHLPSGMYTLRVTSMGKTIQQKLIKAQ